MRSFRATISVAEGTIRAHHTYAKYNIIIRIIEVRKKNITVHDVIISFRKNDVILLSLQYQNARKDFKPWVFAFLLLMLLLFLLYGRCVVASASPSPTRARRPQSYITFISFNKKKYIIKIYTITFFLALSCRKSPRLHVHTYITYNFSVIFVRI